MLSSIRSLSLLLLQIVQIIDIVCDDDDDDDDDEEEEEEDARHNYGEYSDTKLWLVSLQKRSPFHPQQLWANTLAAGPCAAALALTLPCCLYFLLFIQSQFGSGRSYNITQQMCTTCIYVQMIQTYRNTVIMHGKHILGLSGGFSGFRTSKFGSRFAKFRIDRSDR